MSDILHDSLLTTDLKEMFLDGRYYDILVVMPTLRTLELTSAARLMVSLTLFGVGRHESAIRELALSVELAHDEEERSILSEYLLQAMGTRAQKQPKMSSSLPIHEQAALFLRANGNLDDYSLGKTCQTTFRLCSEALKDLLSYSPGNSSKGSRRILDTIFLAIKYHTPLYVYAELQENRALLNRVLADDLSMHPEIDLTYCTTSTMLELISRITSSSIVTSLSICGLIVKHQVIRGFFCHLSGEYSEAISIFKWLMVYFEDSQAILMDRNEYLSSVTRRLVSILLASSYLMEHTRDSGMSSEGPHCILTSILQSSDEMNVTSEYSSGRLCQYFICCGGLYEMLSFSDATKVKVNTDIEALRLSQQQIEEMLRKYIIASTLKAQDDATVIDIYQRILWGLLMYGGVHLQTFWFFKHIRDYTFLELEYGPITLDKEIRFNAFQERDVLAKYSNGHEMVDQIYALRNSMLKEGGGGVLPPEEENLLLIPQVFHYNDQLIISDRYFDEKVPYVSTRDFVSVSPHKVKPKLKGQLKLNGKIVRENIETSTSLMTLWLRSYTTYKGSVPAEIFDYWQSTNMGSWTPESEE